MGVVESGRKNERLPTINDTNTARATTIVIWNYCRMISVAHDLSTVDKMILQMAIFRIEDKETIDLLKEPEVCNSKGTIVSLPRLTTRLRDIAIEYMSVLFSYGTYATIPNPVNVSHEIDTIVFLNLFHNWFAKSCEKEFHGHVNKFFDSYKNMDDLLKSFLTGSSYRFLTAVDNESEIRRLIAFKSHKGKPNATINNYIALLGVSQDITLNFYGATLWLPIDHNKVADREYRVNTQYSRRKKVLCVSIKYGIDEFEKPFIDDKYRIKWPNKQLPLPHQLNALYALYYTHSEKGLELDIDKDFIPKLLDVYAKVIGRELTDGKVEKFRLRLSESLKKNELNRLIGRMIDKINTIILSEPDYSRFILRKPKIESQRGMIIPHNYLINKLQ